MNIQSIVPYATQALTALEPTSSTSRVQPEKVAEAKSEDAVQVHTKN